MLNDGRKIYTKKNKQDKQLSVVTSARVNRFTKLFSCQIPKATVYINVIRNFRHTSNVSLHCLVKLEN